VTYQKQDWVEDVTLVDATHMNHIEDGIAVGSPSYATTLPASPVDGQEAILVDNIANPSYQWRFRYNAGSTSPYKWEFVGGSPAQGYDSTFTGLPTATWASFAPTITLARAGEYFCVTQLSTIAPAGAATQYYYGASVNGATPTGPYGGFGPSGGPEIGFVVENELLTVAAGAAVTVGAYSSAAGAGTKERRLWITPKRVA
jgi:hypothetical protein